MDKPAAIYARVSSDQQKENHTIQSQTAALIEYAKTQGYAVPSQWQFQDEGYSGATLLRPGLEAVRDLAAAGQIAAVLVYSPDRLSRKYAYQVLLAEEFSRTGVELVFLKSPSAATAEDQLLVQFQGMIAEYERAQIAERSRRGKRHRAQQGSINVLSGAPYGYRYVKKSETSAAYYEVVEAEAEVVRTIFEWYTHIGFSIGAITRELNKRHIPTRTGSGRWERSTVWGILGNPAYHGRACFGKTGMRLRQRITRPERQRGGSSPRYHAHYDRPREEWIEIPVTALVTEETFALAQEQLQKNKRFASRRTIRPTLLQSLLVCQHCGYALSGASGGRKPYRKLYYYRCIGSDSWRHLHGPVCQNRPVRQDYLDELIWQEILRLLQDPTLIQSEIERRLQQAKKADPLRQREQYLSREQSRWQNKIDRLLTAYQEELITLEQLRQRMPELRKQEQAVRSQLQSLHMAAQDQSRDLRLADSLAAFRMQLQNNADRLDVIGRRKIIRLLVKEILVGTNTITVRHSIPLASSKPRPTDSVPPPTGPPQPSAGGDYLLCTRRGIPSARQLGAGRLERVLKEKYPSRRPVKSFGGKNPSVNFIRYADDFIVTSKSRELLERDIKPLIEQFLQERGLELSPTKTVITHGKDGFDFLGQNVRRYPDGKRRIKPSKKNMKTFLDDIRRTIKAALGSSAADLIKELNPKIRGWANYHRHTMNKSTLARVDHEIFSSLWRWARRRHPGKTARWRKQKYFAQHNGQDWSFFGETWDDAAQPGTTWLLRASNTAIKRHIKVQGDANPYDPAYETYFEQREEAHMRETFRGTRILRFLWYEQSGLCPVCHMKITQTTGWRLHYHVSRTMGGSTSAENCSLLHPECHDRVHRLRLSVSKPRLPQRGVRSA